MSALRPGLTVAALAACVGLLSACSQDTRTLDTAAAAPLHEHVQTARAALDDNDGDEARQALEEFRTEVQRLSDSGGINADDAQVLVAYSEQIDAGIPASVPEQSTESTTPKLDAPRHLDDVTTPVPSLPDPALPATPDESATPTPRQDDQRDNDDDVVDDAPEPDAPEPDSPDPGTEDPGNGDSGEANPGNEEPAPDNPQPDDSALGDEGTASDGAGE